MPDINETLSSSSLFRFTRELDYLCDNIKNGIAPRYNLENFSMYNSVIPQIPEYAEDPNIQKPLVDLELAVPMICFCDIPMSKTKHHLSIYGGYGIALSKDWGISNRVSPLNYINSGSETAINLRDAIYYISQIKPLSPNDKITELIKTAEAETNSSVIKDIKISIDNLIYNYTNNIAIDTINKKLLRLVRFTKPYQGKFWRDGKYSKVRFYDEKEWRYIPPFDEKDEDNLEPWISKSKFLNEAELTLMNKKLAEKYRLTFEPDDIRCIIIKQNDVQEMIQFLKKESKNKKWNKNKVDELITKIITKEQIEEDF